MKISNLSARSKKRPLIWIVSVVLLILGIQLTQFRASKVTSTKAKTIKYLTISGSGSKSISVISLDPINSDQSDNQTILNSLVTTLVKFGSSGKIEPYLAKRWRISNDSKRWQFFIKEGHICESGLIIDALLFEKALIQNFRRNLEKSDKTEFNLLKGWQKFANSKAESLEGLRVVDNSLIFEFKNVPRDFLNYLRMPYFGLWCPENFSNGSFRQDSKFSSSGPYKIERIVSNSRILLSMRTDQPTFNPDAPQKIEIGYGTISELIASDIPTIGKVLLDRPKFELENFEVIVSHTKERLFVPKTINIQTMPKSIMHPLFEKFRFN